MPAIPDPDSENQALKAAVVERGRRVTLPALAFVRPAGTNGPTRQGAAIPFCFRSWLVIAAAVCLTLTLAYWPFICGKASFYRSDASVYFEPFCNYLASALKSGRLPLWNSLSYCGMAQIAIPSPGLFYPPNWLFALMPFSQALAWAQVLHQSIAGLGMFALCRALGYNRLGSALAGFSIALCGYNFSAATNFTLVATAAWLPWCLACCWNLSRCKKSWKHHFAGCAISCALMILAGRPELWVPGLGAAVAFSALSIWTRPVLTTAVKQVSAMLLGVMLAMPALLPAAEWMQLSNRAAGLNADNVLAWSAGWFDWLGVLLCQPLGDLGINGSPFLPLIAGRTGAIQYIPSLFLGPAVVTLAVWGLFAGKRKHAVALSLFLLAAVAIAGGANTPGASALVEHMQFLRILRYPIKLAIFADFVLVLLAARGLHLCLKNPREGRPQAAAWIFWTGAALCLWHAGSLMSQPSIQSQHQALIHQALSLISMQAFVAMGIGLVICVLRALFAAQRISRRAFSVGAMTLVGIPLMYSATLVQSTGGSSDFYGPQRMKPLLASYHVPTGSGSRLFTVDANQWAPSKQFLSTQSHSLTEAALQYDRLICRPNTHMDSALAQAFGYESASTSSLQNLVYSAIEADTAARSSGNGSEQADLPIYRLCRMTASASVLTRSFTADDYGHKLADFPTLSSRYFDLLRDDPLLNIKLYRVKNPLPRLYFPQSFVAGATTDSVKKLLLDVQDASIDPMDCSYVTGPIPIAVHRTASGRWQEGIELLAEEPERLLVKATTAKENLLVLADTWYPGWYCYVDGKQAQILRVNLGNRGVMLPEGAHTVEFVYSPPSLKLGWAAALLALSIIGWLQLHNPRRRSRHE